VISKFSTLAWHNSLSDFKKKAKQSAQSEELRSPQISLIFLEKPFHCFEKNKIACFKVILKLILNVGLAYFFL